MPPRKEKLKHLYKTMAALIKPGSNAVYFLRCHSTCQTVPNWGGPQKSLTILAVAVGDDVAAAAARPVRVTFLSLVSLFFRPVGCTRPLNSWLPLSLSPFKSPLSLAPATTGP